MPQRKLERLVPCVRDDNPVRVAIVQLIRGAAVDLAYREPGKGP